MGTPGPTTVRLTPCQTGLAVFITLMCALDALWIRQNLAPPRMFDDSQFLIESLDLHEALEKNGLRKFLEESLTPARGFHPPMIKILPVPMYLLFGPGDRPALYSYTLLIPVFGIYLFLLTRTLTGNEKTALLAVVITCLFPLTYGMWRNWMAEFGTAVATVASLHHLLRFSTCRKPLHAILSGAFLGWGLLWKISFPLFVAGPVVYLTIRSLARGWILAGACTVLVAGPFYAKSGRQVIDWLVLSTREDLNQPWSLGPVLAIGTLLRYWLSNINFGVSVYLFLLLLASWGVLLVLDRRRVPSRAVWFAAAWLLPPLGVLSFQVLKEIRHLLPAYPAVGILAAIGLAGALTSARKRIEIPALALLALWPLYQFGASSFDLTWLPRKDLGWGPWIVSTADLELASLQLMPVYTFPAGRMHWPAREAVEVIAKHAAAIRDRTPRVRVAGANPFFNGLVLDYQARLLGHRFMFYSAFDRSLSTADFVVTHSTPGRKYGPLDEGDPLLGRLLEARRLPFVPLAGIPFGDRAQVHIYSRVPDPPLPQWGPWEHPVTEMASQQTFVAGGSPRPVIVPDTGADIRLTYMYVPAAGASLRFGFGVNDGGASSGCPRTCEVAVTDMENDAKAQVLLSTTIDPVAGRPEQSWQEARISLDSFRGKIVEITLSAKPGPSGDASCNRIGWSEIRMIYADRRQR